MAFFVTLSPRHLVLMGKDVKVSTAVEEGFTAAQLGRDPSPGADTE